ncbi:hypothetical protein [Anaerotignum sp.]|uniref:hypothetical protein n=1 Tax=Anaerotignum sp. TaxID=2039241 RepID=UPI0028996B89|nr:hypothetical protein [Anaerotignum sp.]
MIKFKDLILKLDKIIGLALEIKKTELNSEEVLDLSDVKIEDLSATKEERVLINYLKTLSDEEVHAVMSIMYLGRDGYLEFTGNSDQALSYYMNLMDKEKKNIEIEIMLDKFVLYDYLIKGREILIGIM